MSQGPAYFHARHVARTLEPYSSEGGLKKGTLVHQWAESGADAWWDRVEQVPSEVLGQGGRRITATAKWEQERLAERPDAILLQASEIEEYRAQFQAILANRSYEELTSQTIGREFSIRWRDAASGLKLKCRPDAATHDVLWDIKTTREQNPLQTFWKAVVDYGYDIQAVHYLAGARAAGLSATQFVFLVTSTTPPYACHAVTLPKRLLDKATRRLKASMQDLHARITFDHWLPEDSGQVTELFVPEKFMED
jgi:hypothetical protein